MFPKLFYAIDFNDFTRCLGAVLDRGLKKSERPAECAWPMETLGADGLGKGLIDWGKKKLKDGFQHGPTDRGAAESRTPCGGSSAAPKRCGRSPWEQQTVHKLEPSSALYIFF
jgi:hypothetical protein